MHAVGLLGLAGKEGEHFGVDETAGGGEENGASEAHCTSALRLNKIKIRSTWHTRSGLVPLFLLGPCFVWKFSQMAGYGCCLF